MTDWTRAKCLGMDTNIFYPETEDGEDDYSEEATEYARSICVTCPIIFECLRANLNEEHGIFADTNPKERWAMKRRKKK